MVLSRPADDSSSGKTSTEAISGIFSPSSRRNELHPRVHAINVNVKCNGLYLGHAAAQVVSVLTDICEFQSKSESGFLQTSVLTKNPSREHINDGDFASSSVLHNQNIT